MGRLVFSTGVAPSRRCLPGQRRDCCNRERKMNNIIWIVGLVVIVIAVAGFFGLR